MEILIILLFYIYIIYLNVLCIYLFSSKGKYLL